MVPDRPRIADRIIAVTGDGRTALDLEKGIALVNYPEELPINVNGDVVLVRQHVRTVTVDVGLSLVDQTKVVTAASELARNALVYAGGGQVRVEVVHKGIRRGLRMVFSDSGPGIPDIEQALTDRWTTGNGLGLGGSRRLVDEFTLESTPGEGTLITVTKWAR